MSNDTELERRKMTKTKLRELLTQVRDLLADHFCRWKEFGPNGTYCAMGAIRKVAGWTGKFDIVKDAAEASARELHPRLIGAHKPRRDGQRRDDYFDKYPVVFINNHLGKKPILRVFDHAISKVSLTRRKVGK